MRSSRETGAGGFWTRRRAQVQAEETQQAAQEADRAARAEAADRDAAAAEKTDAELLVELNLPDPELLKFGDNLTAFMRKEVPERLRRRALRRFWRTNPVLACVDGLNDYDGDFTNAATDAPGVATAYRVGKGMLHHIETLARDSARTDADAMDSLDHNCADKVAELSSEAAAEEKDAAIAEKMQVEGDAAPASTTKVGMFEPGIGEKTEPPQEIAAQPRRMRFRFGTETG